MEKLRSWITLEMGRYKDLRELRSKRGHGKKPKKQTDPTLHPTIKASSADTPAVPRIKSNIGGRIKQRVRKRAVRMAMLKAMQREKIKKRESKKIEARVGGDDEDDGGEEETSDAESAENVARPFSDENQSWLTPAKSSVRSKDSSVVKTKKRVSFMQADLLEGGSDGNGSEEEEGMML